MKTEWISVKDKMPDRSGEYLVTNGNNKCHVAHYYWYSEIEKYWAFWYQNPFTNPDKITHWMPLPPPPQQ